MAITFSKSSTPFMSYETADERAPVGSIAVINDKYPVASMRGWRVRILERHRNPADLGVFRCESYVDAEALDSDLYGLLSLWDPFIELVEKPDSFTANLSKALGL